jgi:hypothetical protein
MTPLILAAGHPGNVPAIPSDWPGWAVLIILGFFLLRWVLGVLGLRK